MDLMKKHYSERDIAHCQHHPNETTLFNYFLVIPPTIWSLSTHHMRKAILIGYLQFSMMCHKYFWSTSVTLEELKRDYTLYCLNPTGTAWYDTDFRRGLISWCARLNICFFHLINIRYPHLPHPSTESLPPVQLVITTKMLNRTNKDLP